MQRTKLIQKWILYECTKFGQNWLRNSCQKSKMAATKFSFFFTFQQQTAVISRASSRSPFLFCFLEPITYHCQSYKGFGRTMWNDSLNIKRQISTDKKLVFVINPVNPPKLIVIKQEYVYSCKTHDSRSSLTRLANLPVPQHYDVHTVLLVSYPQVSMWLCHVLRCHVTVSCHDMSVGRRCLVTELSPHIYTISLYNSFCIVTLWISSCLIFKANSNYHHPSLKL